MPNDMKPLLLTLTAIAGLAALPTQAEARDHKHYDRNDSYYGGQNYRGSCQTGNRAYYSDRSYSRPVYYREAYVQPVPVRYYDSGCRPQPVQVCRPQPRGGLLTFIFGR